MASIVGRFKKGRITVNVVQGEYKGKKTYSYTLQKQVFKDNEWQDSDFFTITDLIDLQCILQKIVSHYVKFVKVEPKPKEPEPVEEPEPEVEEPPF